MKPGSKLMTIFTSLLLSSGISAAPDLEGRPEAVADALHAALVAGDEPGIRSLLDDEVLIFESGGKESSLEEYAGHHMHADMAFMKSVEREVLARKHFVSAEQAVVSTHARLSGTYRDKPVDVDSTETLVLTRDAGTWRITHIHWSSRTRQGQDE